MAAKRGLGKGLSALLPDGPTHQDLVSDAAAVDRPNQESVKTSAEDTSKTGEIFIALEKIKANPGQPRKDFDEAELEELAESIKQQGIIQPLLVELDEDGTYTIVAGERRFRAARMAGLSEVPVLLRKYSEEKRMIVSLIENIQRSNLNAIDEAAA